MPKYAKWTILGVLALVLGVVIFFCAVPKTEKVELAITAAEPGLGYSTEKELCDDFYVFNAEGDSWVRNTKEASVSYYTGSSLIFDVVLTNFSDEKAFSNATYGEWLAKFNQITNYFLSESHGKLTMDFNVHVADLDISYNDYDKNRKNGLKEALEGFTLYDQAREKVHTTLKTAGEPDCKFLVVSVPEENDIEWSSIFWPHATILGYIQSFDTRMILCNSHYCDISVLCHEIYHILGLPDLYSPDVKYVGQADMMGTNTEHGNASAYFKQKLGWYNESNFSDAQHTNIENITETRTYSLDMATINGTNAYKFGVNGDEYFLVEPRLIWGQKYLAINRINTNYFSNMNADDESETVVYSFPGHSYGNGIFIRLFGPGDSIGQLSSQKKLYYSDGAPANYCISNINTSIDGVITFHFAVVSDVGAYVPEDGYVDDFLISGSKTFISVKDGAGANITPTNIYVYDAAQKAWEPLTVGVVYVGNKQYFTFDKQPTHTKVKVVYGEYMFMQNREIALADGVAVYDIQFNKTIISHVGDFVKGAQSALADLASNIYNFFKK